MQIVGMTGSIGSGKTTFGELLDQQTTHSRHWESWQIVAEVANGLRAQGSTPAPDDIEGINAWLAILPDLAQKVVLANLPPEACIVSLEKIHSAPTEYIKLLEYLSDVQGGATDGSTPITDINKEANRSILQWLGGYLFIHDGPGVWYKELLRRVDAAGDALELATIGCVRFPDDAKRVVAAGGVIIRVERGTEPAQDANDLTERDRSETVATTVVHNNGTIDELAAVAQTIWADLKAGSLQSEYWAAPKHLFA